MKKNFCYGLIIFNLFFFTFAQAEQLPSKVIMSYWSNTYSYEFYPVPGSLSENGIKDVNANFRAQLNDLNILAYAALSVHPNGIIHFKNSYKELSASDSDFCQHYPLICMDNYDNMTPKLGSFSAFAHLQNQNLSLLKIISIGGSNSDASFDHAIQYPNNFVNSALEIIHNYKLAGIDLDFELQNTFTSTQAAKYASLIKLLRQTLGPTKIIAIEIPPDSQTQDSIDINNWHIIANNVNYISLMGYEFHSYLYHPYITGFNSNLYPEPTIPKIDNFYVISDDAAIKNLLRLNIPAHKILLGIPAYSHTYGGVSAFNSGLYQKFIPEKTPTFDALGKGITSYNTVLHLLREGFQEHELFSKGTVSAAYAYNSRTKQFITYENAASLTAKVNYILENNLAGAMVWNIAEDLPASDMNSVLGILNDKLKNGG